MKQEIVNQLYTLVNERIDTASQAIAQAKESRDSDPKSSAGDKHETGRAMMQIEMENNEVQLQKALALKSELDKLITTKPKNQIGFGSLVQTNEGTYFISVGVGKLNMDGKTVYAISLASPLGTELKDKTVGEKIEFQGRPIIIEVLD